ncbi:MAG: ABC transporter ATP-binding protein, partial [Acidobacteriaceae bacterium]|nr:ABC transporter ATP-binding protein [Acidobacteriaceae bacterium]
MAAALEFEHMTKQYRSLRRRNRVVALDDFSLAVDRGEIFGFLGPNGAGKTTAIHIAMGLMRATRGSGHMLGQAFGHAPTRARVGFLAENVALYHRSAARLIRFYGALNGMRDPELRQRTVEVLEELGLANDAGRNAAKFSRGMLQRVGLAQALINDPELLLLDEPTSALDPLGRVAVRELLLSARKAGKTIFVSSHLLSEIELICDRVAILHNGRLARLGRMRDLLESRERIEITARGIDRAAFSGAVSEDGVVRFEALSSAQRAVIE